MLMARLEEYANKFKHIQLERRGGILHMRLHTDGGALLWGKGPHDELGNVTMTSAAIRRTVR
jgi:hypothetical protein